MQYLLNKQINVVIILPTNCTAFRQHYANDYYFNAHMYIYNLHQRSLPLASGYTCVVERSAMHPGIDWPWRHDYDYDSDWCHMFRHHQYGGPSKAGGIKTIHAMYISRPLHVTGISQSDWLIPFCACARRGSPALRSARTPRTKLASYVYRRSNLS